MVALTIALLAGLSPSASAAAAPTGETRNTDAAAQATWKVRNTGDVGVGAIQVWVGHGLFYRQGGGLYDAVIPGFQVSGWPSTQGFYVGPGYCLRTRFWENSSGTDLSKVTRYGPGQWGPFSARYGIDIRALELSNPLCARD